MLTGSRPGLRPQHSQPCHFSHRSPESRRKALPALERRKLYSQSPARSPAGWPHSQHSPTAFGDLTPPPKDLRAASELSRQQPREAPHDRDTAGTHQGSPGALPRLPGSSLQAPSAFTVANSGCSPFHGPQASGSKHSAHTNSLSPQNHLHYITLIYRDGNSLAQGHTASKR